MSNESNNGLTALILMLAALRAVEGEQRPEQPEHSGVVRGYDYANAGFAFIQSVVSPSDCVAANLLAMRAYALPGDLHATVNHIIEAKDVSEHARTAAIMMVLFKSYFNSRESAGI